MRCEPANFVRIKKRLVATKSKNQAQRKLKNGRGRWSQKKAVLQALSRILLIFHQNGFCLALFFYRLRDHPLGVLWNFGCLTPGGYRVRASGLFLRPCPWPSLVETSDAHQPMVSWVCQEIEKPLLFENASQPIRVQGFDWWNVIEYDWLRILI